MSVKGRLKKIFKNKLNLIGIVFLLIGIILIGSSIYMKYKGQYEQKNRLNKFENKIQNEVKNKNQGKKNNINTPLKAKEGDTIGIMTIPKIGLKVTIGQGVDMKTLKYAVGHFPDTAMPGEVGNFCVAGHRSYTYNKYFNRLNEVKNGDEIIIQTINGEFKYTVDKISTVEPKDTYVLNPTKNSTITLVTCTPIRIATHRLIIKGTLQK